jgi:uncharacterized protein (TIGR03435 family)
MRKIFGIRKNIFLDAAIIATLAVPFPLGILVAPSIRAQSASARLEFEVASVKLNTDDGRTDSSPVRSGDRVLMHNNQIGSMILYAYQVFPHQIIGNIRLPDGWNWYDVEARTAGSPSDDEIRLMFQSMLEDRFKLKVHRETREMEAYKLVIAKNGPKLKPATVGDYKTTIDERPVTIKNGTIRISFWKEGAHLMGKSVTMAQLANSLIRELDGPVVDATGIAGTFDFDVIFAPKNWPPDSDFSPPFLMAALKNDLGLTIEKSKASVEVLVIDRLEKPTPN